MIRRDPLFKGCTRPAMIKGIPVVPAFCVCFGIIFIAICTSLFVCVLIFPAVFIMRAMCKNDDQKFRILGLWMLFRVQDYNRRFWKASSCGPVTYKKRWK